KPAHAGGIILLMQPSIKSIVAPIAFLVCALLLSVAHHGKQFTVYTPQITQSAPTPAPEPSPQPAATATQPAQTPSENQARIPTTFFVMIDPSHGGTDQGALLGDKLLEKDVTLAFARRLK